MRWWHGLLVVMVVLTGSLVALSLGVGWMAWVAAGVVFAWAIGGLFGLWPIGGVDS